MISISQTVIIMRMRQGTKRARAKIINYYEVGSSGRRNATQD